MTTEPCPMSPRSSASSIIARAMRSLMLPPGFARSCLIQTSTRGSKSRFTRTWGVLPIVARMDGAFTGRSFGLSSGRRTVAAGRRRD